jgi:hypothetical protein
MADEYGTDLGKAQPRAAQLYLGALTTIHEEQFSTDLDDL